MSPTTWHVMCGRVATIAYINESTTKAYGTEFILSPSGPDVGQPLFDSRRLAGNGVEKIASWIAPRFVGCSRPEIETLFLGTMLTDLHPENVTCKTQVLYGEFQPLLMNEFNKLFDMSIGEQHIMYITDEEDGWPILCILWLEAMVLINLRKTDRLYEVVKFPIPLPRYLLEALQTLLESEK